MQTFARHLFAALAALQPGEARAAVAALVGVPMREVGSGTQPLPAIQLGARQGRFETRVQARHYSARQPAIRRTQAAISRWLGYAQSETLRNLEHASLSLRASEAVAGRGCVPLPTKTQAEGDAAALHAAAAFDLLFDRARFSEGLLAALRAENQQTLDDSAAQFAHEIGRPDDPLTMPAPQAVAYLQQRGNKLSGVPDEIYEQVRAQLLEGLDAGESQADLARRIRSTFAGIDEGRAETIASTEVGAAYGVSRQAAMEAAGSSHKRWLTSGLPNVRLLHAEAAIDPRNQAVPVDQPFQVGGEALMFPGDPDGRPDNVINCHCVSIAVADPEETIGGYQYQQPENARNGGEVVVRVDPQKFDQAFAKAPELYVPPGGGENAHSLNKRARFNEFLQNDVARQGVKIETPRVSLSPEGVADFTDGRHRFSVLRDLGVPAIPISMDTESAARARQLGLTATSA